VRHHDLVFLKHFSQVIAILVGITIALIFLGHYINGLKPVEPNKPRSPPPRSASSRSARSTPAPPAPPRQAAAAPKPPRARSPSMARWTAR
jgi:hypothetical protein